MELDSKAVFKERVLLFGLESVYAEMEKRGWITMGAFAFSCSAPPGSAAEADCFFAEVAGPLTANNKESPLLPALGRLFFEAWTCSSVDLKHRLERRDDEPPRKLPAVEREERRLRLATRLGPGMQLDNFNETSNALVNEAAEMFEESAIKYIAWSRCTHRLAEVAGMKKVEEVLTDNNGFIKLQRKVQKISANHHDLLRARQCLTRRRVALGPGHRRRADL